MLKKLEDEDSELLEGFFLFCAPTLFLLGCRLCIPGLILLSSCIIIFLLVIHSPRLLEQVCSSKAPPLAALHILDACPFDVLLAPSIVRASPPDHPL